VVHAALSTCRIHLATGQSLCWLLQACSAMTRALPLHRNLVIVIAKQALPPSMQLHNAKRLK
jgi:hypothetical protein